MVSSWSSIVSYIYKYMILYLCSMTVWFSILYYLFIFYIFLLLVMLLIDDNQQFNFTVIFIPFHASLCHLILYYFILFFFMMIDDLIH